MNGKRSATEITKTFFAILLGSFALKLLNKSESLLPKSGIDPDDNGISKEEIRRTK